jgi:hypothetical protein
VGEIVGDRGDDAGGGPFNVSVQCFFHMICTFLSVEHCDGDIAQSFLFQVKFEGETRWYDGSSLIAATPPLACCTVDQEATAAGDSGFKFEDNGQHVVFPDGPTTLLANQIVGDTKASRADCEAAYWTFEMSNNPCAFYYSCIAPAAVSLLLHSFKHFPGPGLAV